VGFKVKEKPRIVNSVLSHLVVEKTYNPLNTKFGFFFFFFFPRFFNTRGGKE